MWVQEIKLCFFFPHSSSCSGWWWRIGLCLWIDTFLRLFKWRHNYGAHVAMGPTPYWRIIYLAAGPIPF